MPRPGAKADLRREVAARRRNRPQAERELVAEALSRRVLALPEFRAARTVAAYVSYPSEPGTAPLRAALRARGVRVLLPVLLDDADLDWVADVDRTAGEAAAAALGRSAISQADVVVCPATAVTATGARLGKGGGSYDRALARVPASAAVVALVHDDEVVEHVPTEPHDRPIDVAVTPRRTLRPGRATGRAPAGPRWPPRPPRG